MPKILVVDDDPDFVNVTRTILRSRDYDVITASNGEQALKVMRRDKPDLVLLDIMMSYILDGLDVSREMTQDDALKDVPVIMVTSLTGARTQADLLSLKNRDVVCCHLNDAPAGVPIDQQRDGRRELPCATGVIDLKGFLGALVKIGYDGPICAEPFSRELRAMSTEDAMNATAAAMKKAFALVE